MQEGVDFTFYNVIPPHIPEQVRQRCRQKNTVTHNWNGRKVYRSYMSDAEVSEYLEEYGDLGYDKLPEWLKQELVARRLRFEPHHPTEKEIEETKKDLEEHQVFNNDLTLSTINALLKKGLRYNG